MLKMLSLVLVSAVAFNAQANTEMDPRYFELTKVKMTDVTEQYASEADIMNQVGNFEDCNAKVTPLENPGLSLDPLDQINIVIDKIVNIGRKVWAVAELGRPVVNITTYTANALPQGLQCWTDLTGWQVPQSKVYRVQYLNGFNVNVVDFAYRVGFTAGGALDGKGKYITNATIMPAALNVSWGFNFNAQAEVPSVFNTGSKVQPVAGMQMLMKWNIKTIVSHIEHTETFYVGGDNTMKHLE